MPQQNPTQIMLDNIRTSGLEHYGRYYGIYRAICTDNDDPNGRHRIKAKCPTVGHGAAPDVWIDPAMSGAGANKGFFFPPTVGDAVWISFESGDPQSPNMYLGGWWGKEDVPAEMGYSDNGPEKRGIVTRAGHLLLFVDEPGSESVRLMWHKPADGDESLSDSEKSADRTQGDFSFLAFTTTGGVQLVNSLGSNINIDAENETLVVMDQSGNSISLDGDGIRLIDNAGNVVTMEGGEITIVANSKAHLVSPVINLKAGTVVVGDGASFSAVIGEIWKTWATAHTHTSATGPTGPPIVPPPENSLSQGVKVRT